jgi:hypothetical protein
MSLDLLPMLLLSLLLLTSGGDADRVEVVTGGVQQVESRQGALVLADGAATIPGDAVVQGSVHVLGGSLVVEGRVAGDVLVLAGEVRVAEGGQVGGEVRHYGGELDVGSGGGVVVTGLDVGTTRGDPAADAVATLAAALVLALLGGLVARHRPGSVRTAGEAVRRHPVITLTVGALVAVTALSVLVFMAFTLVLLPVTVLGLGVGVVLLLGGVLAVGGLVGRLLPVRSPSVATATGVGAVVVGLRLLELVPVVGDLVVLGVLLAGLGAVLLTYLGLRPFVPVSIPA